LSIPATAPNFTTASISSTARRVRHHDADRIAAHDATGGQRRRVAVGGLVRLAVGHGLVVEPDEHAIAVPCRAVLEGFSD
jgi:hypothetical protein